MVENDYKHIADPKRFKYLVDSIGPQRIGGPTELIPLRGDPPSDLNPNVTEKDLDEAMLRYLRHNHNQLVQFVNSGGVVVEGREVKSVAELCELAKKQEQNRKY